MSPQKGLDDGTIPPAPKRVYSNQGNPPLIDLLGKGCNRLLDIGCGAGDTRHPVFNVFGIDLFTNYENIT